MAGQSHVGQHVQGERALAHARTASHHDQVSGLHANQHPVQIFEAAHEAPGFLLAVHEPFEVLHSGPHGLCRPAEACRALPGARGLEELCEGARDVVVVRPVRDLRHGLG